MPPMRSSGGHTLRYWHRSVGKSAGLRTTTARRPCHKRVGEYIARQYEPHKVVALGLYYGLKFVIKKSFKFKRGGYAG
ncbi:hypothetical protein [Campylobacter sp. 19-13652]|uniref:hypothetical protein n=1 Tax=Campylobacter sp. 19-13652 TaxID=2840180 RepID=UPI001C79899D|nr:hypothetical protein [Campylobacter sp. 19-13652]BCX80158.1 hypothetical protein LBC_16200 [Campylobacter sp. 19-13652]